MSPICLKMILKDASFLNMKHVHYLQISDLIIYSTKQGLYTVTTGTGLQFELNPYFEIRKPRAPVYSSLGISTKNFSDLSVLAVSFFIQTAPCLPSLKPKLMTVFSYIILVFRPILEKHGRRQSYGGSHQ